MSLIFATQVTALATAVLAVFAIVTSIFAVLAFRKQSREVRDQASMLDEQRKINKAQINVLSLQAEELRDSTAVLRRAQAARVFIKKERDRDLAPVDAVRGSDSAERLVAVTVVNTSDQPIYGAEIRWYIGTAGYGEPNPEPVGIIMPEKNADGQRLFPHDADMDHSGAEVRFTDASGVRWRRHLDGTSAGSWRPSCLPIAPRASLMQPTRAAHRRDRGGDCGVKVVRRDRAGSADAGPEILAALGAASGPADGSTFRRAFALVSPRCARPGPGRLAAHQGSAGRRPAGHRRFAKVRDDMLAVEPCYGLGTALALRC